MTLEVWQFVVALVIHLATLAFLAGATWYRIKAIEEKYRASQQSSTRMQDELLAAMRDLRSAISGQGAEMNTIKDLVTAFRTSLQDKVHVLEVSVEKMRADLAKEQNNMYQELLKTANVQFMNREASMGMHNENREQLKSISEDVKVALNDIRGLEEKVAVLEVSSRARGGGR